MSAKHQDKAGLLRWIHGPGARAWGTDPDARDPEVLERWLGGLDHVFGAGRYFPLHVDGWSHLPEAPVLFVGNHSGGTTIPDVWGLMYAWCRHFGERRIIHPLAHEMVFAIRATGEAFSRLGVMRASRAQAMRVLTEWRRDVLVMPGGDLDTWRPWGQRHEVRFGGRTGYARMALLTGVPIVPVAHVGAHDSLFVLTDGRRLAERVGLQRIARASVLPIHLSLPFGLTFGPTPHVPLPVTLRYRFGAPVPPPAGSEPGREPTAAEVSDYDEAVRAALQGLIDDLAAERASFPQRVRERVRAIRAEVRGLAEDRLAAK